MAVKLFGVVDDQGARQAAVAAHVIAQKQQNDPGRRRVEAHDESTCMCSVTIDTDHHRRLVLELESGRRLQKDVGRCAVDLADVVRVSAVDRIAVVQSRDDRSPLIRRAFPFALQHVIVVGAVAAEGRI